LQIIQICFVFSNLESKRKKKTPSSHTLVPLTLLTTFVPSLASSSFSLVYPNPSSTNQQKTLKNPRNSKPKNPSP